MSLQVDQETQVALEAQASLERQASQVCIQQRSTLTLHLLTLKANSESSATAATTNCWQVSGPLTAPWPILEHILTVSSCCRSDRYHRPQRDSGRHWHHRRHGHNRWHRNYRRCRVCRWPGKHGRHRRHRRHRCVGYTVEEQLPRRHSSELPAYDKQLSQGASSSRGDCMTLAGFAQPVS